MDLFLFLTVHEDPPVDQRVFWKEMIGANYQQTDRSYFSPGTIFYLNKLSLSAAEYIPAFKTVLGR